MISPFGGWLPRRRPLDMPPCPVPETVPAEPPAGSAVTWKPGQGCTYLTARDLAPPRWPDPVVFGPEPVHLGKPCWPI